MFHLAAEKLYHDLASLGCRNESFKKGILAIIKGQYTEHSG
jgi:hypothetical protein